VRSDVTVAVETGQAFVFLSRLLGSRVVDSGDAEAGRVSDLLVVPGRVYPESSALVVTRGAFGRRPAVVEWAAVESIDAAAREVRLSVDAASLSGAPARDERARLSLRGDVLDQQVVDTHNHRVIRVNDVSLLVAGDLLMVAHVDVGARAVIRRLGYEPLFDFFGRVVSPRSGHLKRERLISWKHVQLLPGNRAGRTIRLDIPRTQLARIPAADLGEIFLDLSSQQQLAVFRSMDLVTRAKVFIHVDAKTQRSLVEELDEQEAAALLQAVPSDEGTDFLELLPKAAAERLLALMETRHSRKLSQLLGYSSDSAGGIMIAEYTAFPREMPVREVLERIKARALVADPGPFVAIVDEGNRLVGATVIRSLLVADPLAPLATAALPRFHHVHPSSSLREVAYLMEKYRAFTIPVVDDDRVLLGIITMDDVLERIIPIAWRRVRRRGKAVL
jgi:magnesium transporter